MIKFIGRVNSQGRQNFKSGVLKASGRIYKVKVFEQQPLLKDGDPVLDDDGKPIFHAVEVEKDAQDKYEFTPRDISKDFDFGLDEPILLVKYSKMFAIV